MSSSIYSSYNKRKTKQSEPIPGEAQVKNSAGGYVYELDKWARLDRFLILGSDAPTYYASAQKLTKENAAVVEACLRDDADRVIRAIVDVSDAGRAPKNDQAIFALALAASVQNPDAQGLSSESIRLAALGALQKVCRIPTHLFHFLEYLKGQRGFGRSVRTAIGDWYARWTPDQLAYEVVKYQQRDGWTHRDALRKAHAKMPAEHQAILRWLVKGETEVNFGQRRVLRNKQGLEAIYPSVLGTASLPNIIEAFEEAKTATPDQLVVLIRQHGLTREMVPSEALDNPDVWAALLDKMPLTAMIRNLGKMSAVGLLKSASTSAKQVVARLGDKDYIKKSRVHPLAVLVAMKIYAQGHGEKGKLTWTPVRQVVDALDAAFYLAFGNVEPTGKRLQLALDVSGSMTSPLMGSPLSCREACAALALVTANVEQDYVITGFTASGAHSRGGARGRFGFGECAISELSISPRQRLDDVVRYMDGLGFSGTDCALPMVWASEQKHDFDGFVVLTDSETWAGNIHPTQALREYRKQRVAEAKLVVVGMTATGFTIADPNDAGMLDVVGFDTATPQAISAFVKA